MGVGPIQRNNGGEGNVYYAGNPHIAFTSNIILTFYYYR